MQTDVKIDYLLDAFNLWYFRGTLILCTRIYPLFSEYFISLYDWSR